jgi:hypothetical protein
MMSMKIIEKFGTKITVDGSVQISLNDEEYYFSIIFAKMFMEQFRHSISQVEKIIGDQEIPDIFKTGIEEILAKKDKWLEDL